MKIAVLGAGSWGTALGQVLSENSHDILLWHLEQNFVDEINESHIHPFLPEINFSRALQFTSSLEDIYDYLTSGKLKPKIDPKTGKPIPLTAKDIGALPKSIHSDLVPYILQNLKMSFHYL